MKRHGLSSVGIAAGLFAGFFAASASAQGLNTVAVAGDLVRPIFVTSAPGDYSRLYIIEKQGRIRVVENGVLLTTPFLDIDPIVSGGGTDDSERGLLGLAFHPNFATNRKFYVNYTAVAGSGDTVVAEYTAPTANVANAASGNVILTFDQPQSNHNGGWIAFGPDNYLYIATGDGGNANDSGPGHVEPNGNAQTITSNLLGKLLRIDVNGDDFPADANRDYAIPPTNPFVGVTGDDEIWAYGLRNAWRNAFDRTTGDLYIADVGQNAWEEIDVQPAAAAGGRNYGWRCREGFVATNYANTDCTPVFTSPIYAYSHTAGCAITGGYVYRGCAIPSIQGLYFFADYCTSKIWSLRWNGSTSYTNFVDRTTDLQPSAGGTIGSITSFGQDAYGELYICDQAAGIVYKIVPDTVVNDCDGNGVTDACEIAANPALDSDGDGRLNVCECRGDINNDNTTNLTDLAVLLASFGTCQGSGGYNPLADLTADNCVDLSDLAVLLGAFGCN